MKMGRSLEGGLGTRKERRSRFRKEEKKEKEKEERVSENCIGKRSRNEREQTGPSPPVPRGPFRIRTKAGCFYSRTWPQRLKRLDGHTTHPREEVEVLRERLLEVVGAVGVESQARWMTRRRRTRWWRTTKADYCLSND